MSSSPRSSILTCLIPAALAAIVFTLAGCFARPEPEGPAEQIGKGIDQISRGLEQYERDTAGRRTPGAAVSGAPSAVATRRPLASWEREALEREAAQKEEEARRYGGSR